jgi:Family of unknown function (DUF5989)
MSGDAAFALGLVGLLLLEATNYFLGGDQLVAAQVWAFMRVRKRWWLGPIAMMLALLGLLVIFTQGSAVAPFVYTLF